MSSCTPDPGRVCPIPTTHDDARHPIPLVILDGAGIELADLDVGLEFLFQRPVRFHHETPTRPFAFATQRLGAGQDGPLVDSVALAACCRRSTSASLSATWARFGSSSRAW